MAALGPFLAARRWWVLGFWIVVLAAIGATLAPRADSVLKGGGYTAGGSDSVLADRDLDQHFNSSATRNVTVVFHFDASTVDATDFVQQVTDASDRLQKVDRVRSVQTFFSTHNPGMVSADRHTTLAVVVLSGDDTSIQRTVPTLRDALSGLSIDHYVTGQPAVDNDLIEQSQGDLKISEAITVPVILILLLLAFRTVVSALTPLVLGVTSIVVASSGIYVMGSNLDTSVFALNVGSMLGLGLSIDYALFLVSRYRDEMAVRRDVPEALAVTMATAGRTILFSAVTVILAMLILGFLTLDIPLVRSIALAVMLVAAAAALAALTLLPAVLALLGGRVELLPILPRRKVGGQGGFWYRFSRVVMARPWLWLILGVALLAVLASPVRDLTLGPSGSTAETESKRGADVAAAAFGGSYLSPLTLVVDSGSRNGVFTRPFLDYLDRLTQAVKKDRRVEQVTSLPTVLSGIPHDQYLALTPDAFRASPAAQLPVVDLDQGAEMATITIVSRYGAYDALTEDLVDDLRNTVIPSVSTPPATRTHVGGQTALFVDFRNLLNSRLPIVVASVMALIFVILLMFFQSLFLPIKAMLLNLASVLATYGALVAVFKWGWGEKILDFHSFHSLSAITPITLYVVLFGLSTDYEVLMLSRVREHYLRTKNNSESVAAGLQNTAGIITAAGLILIGTFASFSTGRVMGVKEIGIGLAIAVLIDSTVVRIVLVPATMRLAGRANWWMPAWLKRIVPEISEGSAPPTAEPAPAARPDTKTLVMPAMSMGARLVPSGSWNRGDLALSPERGLTIGRDPSNEVNLPGNEVSRFHARIHHELRGWMITDLKSANGVWVNGARIEPETPFMLRAADTIAIGGFNDSVFWFAPDTAATTRPPVAETAHPKGAGRQGRP